ncbi:MAG TPA: YfhO family protein [Isosphaeraceae bacterium]|nr:YfhO family protein [Isosphaeraceae bacterium]
MARVELGRQPVWTPQPPRWGLADCVALGIWTLAIVGFFWPAVSLQKALFYFDITEINEPYRHFFASELRAGRFSRWCPGLYCGFPLFSESQAGYLHPLKYVLYPWLASWRAFNLDTVLSIWLTGLGAYGWLRRHVAPAGALTGASVFSLSGFLWAHLIHTSMTNALTSVPFAIWALEWTWSSGKLRGIALGAAAMACQVFAGHLQDALLTGMAVGLYGIYGFVTERGFRNKQFALGSAAGLVGLAIVLSAVQWIPSKELLDRSPRSGGLSWDDLTYGSWHPELLPTVLVREAYGTRARDTDWMDGFYPYHEMNVYLGVGGLALAIVGARAYRDRWAGFWVLLAGLGGLCMLGRFTFLFDRMNLVPIIGSGRIPVRYHLWVSLAAAALAAIGVDRLARPGVVRLRGAVMMIALLALASVPILIYLYSPAWTHPERWREPYQLLRFRWLGQELIWASSRTAVLACLTWLVAASAARAWDPAWRRRWASCLPVLVLADLLGAHWQEVPTVAPAYWTQPPASAVAIKADPKHSRVIGFAERSAGEPGYASKPIDFFVVRDPLAWSLPMVWGLDSAVGETPIISRRYLRYTDTARIGEGRLDLESVSHLLIGHPGTSPVLSPPEHIGAAYIFGNPHVLPRVRLLGRPLYVADEREAARTLARIKTLARDQVIVEDPARPLPADATVSGEARIVREVPERVEIRTSSAGPAYLVLADTFDPGWSATVDNRPASIRPAYVAFRAVFLPEGEHTVIFTYSPAGFAMGRAISLGGLAVAALLLAWPRRVATLGPEHGDAGWPRRWPWAALGVAVAIVVLSLFELGPRGLQVQRRWYGSVHPFTWGAKIEAIKPAPPKDR